MNTKTLRIIYLVSTGLLTALMLMSVSMYFFNYEIVSDTFMSLGYPTYLIYPLAVAKILGLIAIWSNKSKPLKQMAYAGFFFDFMFALAAHINAGDGQYLAALLAMILLFISFYADNNLQNQSTE